MIYWVPFGSYLFFYLLKEILLDLFRIKHDIAQNNRQTLVN